MVRLFFSVVARQGNNQCQQSTVNNPSALRHFNLSHNKSLQTLEVTAESVAVAGNTASSSLRTVLSTITSPMLLNIVIIYQDFDIDYWGPCYYSRSCKPGPAGAYIRSPEEKAACRLRHQQIFKVLHDIYGMQEFQLVLSVDVPDSMMEYTLGMLEYLVKVEKMRGRLDYLSHRPLVIAEIPGPHGRPQDLRVGVVTEGPVLSVAL